MTSTTTTSRTPPERPTPDLIAKDPACLWRYMDDYSDWCLLEGLRETREELSQWHAAAAVHARIMKPGRYPRLHFVGGKRAGRVGAARFKGRYHPHLIYDRDRSIID
jgi:hypothetical protein